MSGDRPPEELTLDDVTDIATVVARLSRGRGKWFDATRVA